MADNKFTNDKKVQIIARACNDEMDYIRASKSYMSQNDFKGKKFGRDYKIYIPDPGKVVDGVVADPDTVEEIEYNVRLENKNTSCELSAWNSLGDVDSFTDEIAIPRGTALARSVQKTVVRKNAFRSAQAVVSNKPSFGVLSDAAAMLIELAVNADMVSFHSPTVLGKVAASGLANFIPAQQAKDIYTKNYLGEYAGASQIGLAVLPTVTTPNTIPVPTVTLTAVNDADGNVVGFEPVSKVSGTGLVAGLAYKAAGLKVVDPTGIETEQDFIVIVQDSDGNVPEIRITVDGKANGNPNAWVPAGTTSLTLEAILEPEKTYYVGQVRTKEALAYDDYRFDDLPGSDNEAVSTEGAVTVKMSQYGDGRDLSKLVRLDLPFAAGIPDARFSVTTYIVKD